MMIITNQQIFKKLCGDVINYSVNYEKYILMKNANS
jgi:hypothetical protein